ncbi:MAG: hypothetical protein ACI9GW_000771 [Halieaceae bacterium]|jgi:hypothetical protein
MKVKPVALFLLMWFTCQSAVVLADALIPVTHDDVVVALAAHCDTDLESTTTEQHSRAYSQTAQSCGLECQCCASCSSLLTDNGEIPDVFVYLGVADIGNSPMIPAATAGSFFRPPIFV